MENEILNSDKTEELNKNIQMYIFIFESISEVSENYHPGGGLVIIAESREKAVELISKNQYIKISENEWKFVNSYKLADTNIEPKYFVMPDAGCC